MKCDAVKLESTAKKAGPVVVYKGESFQAPKILTCVRSEHSDKVHIDGTSYLVRDWVL